MDSTLNSTLAQVSRKLSVDKKLVEAIYDSYWEFFRNQISQVYYPSIVKKERKQHFISINLPYLGKLFVSERKLLKYDKQQHFYQNVKRKKNKTKRESGSGD